LPKDEFDPTAVEDYQDPDLHLPKLMALDLVDPESKVKANAKQLKEAIVKLWERYTRSKVELRMMMKRMKTDQLRLQAEVARGNAKIAEWQTRYEQLLRETKTQATQAQTTLLQTNQHQSQMLSMALTHIRDSRNSVRRLLQAEIGSTSARAWVKTTTPDLVTGVKLEHIHPDARRKMTEELKRNVDTEHKARAVVNELDENIKKGVEVLKTADKKIYSPQEREEFKAELQLLAAKRHILTAAPELKTKLGERPPVLALTDVD